MKILITNGHLQVGGVEKSLVTLLRSIDCSQHQVDLLLFEGEGEYLKDIPPEVNIIVWDLRDTYGSLRSVCKRSLFHGGNQMVMVKLILTMANKVDRRCLKLLKWFHIADKEYDCAIAYRVDMPADFVAFAVRARKKLVWWHHGEFDYPDWMVNRWLEAFQRSDRIVCVSKSSAQMLSEHIPKVADRIGWIPNMVEPDEIRRKAGLFQPYSELTGKMILVSVGRMSEEKHIADTVFVAESLLRRGIKGFIWYLIGDGVERERIVQLIRERQLEDCFCLVGNQENPYPYIKYADIFVHPSFVESQCITVLEAMALNKICVVTSSLGTDEYVKDGWNAIKTEQTLSSLMEKTEYAIRHRNELDFSEGQEITVRKYTPDTVMKRFYEAIS